MPPTAQKTPATPVRPPKSGAPTVTDPARDRAMVQDLDKFLDELAAGHRDRMEEVVAWLTEGGRLEYEIQRSVQSLSVLFHKWAIEIGFLLRMRGTVRFNEIKTQLQGIGSRTLSQRLKSLEEQDIVHREVFPEVPVRVEYSLTPRGMRMADLFLPVIAHLRITGVRREAREEREEREERGERGEREERGDQEGRADQNEQGAAQANGASKPIR